MADVTILFSGYNSVTQRYNQGGYNTDVGFTGLTSSTTSVTVNGEIIVDVSGQSISASAGTVTIPAGIGVVVQPIGIQMTATTSTINIWSPVVPGQTPNWTEIAA